MIESKPRLDKGEEAVFNVQAAYDPEYLKQRLGRLVKHRPVTEAEKLK